MVGAHLENETITAISCSSIWFAKRVDRANPSTTSRRHRHQQAGEQLRGAASEEHFSGPEALQLAPRLTLQVSHQPPRPPKQPHHSRRPRVPWSPETGLQFEHARPATVSRNR
jgi:hypothetical protein